MRIHVLQHVPFEDAANIGVWACERGLSLTRTRLYLDEPLPGIQQIDWLVIMGGPMNVYEHERFPWLVTEKQYISRAIETRRFVLGICLGAQLIADCLGGRVTANAHREIGWFDVSLTPEAVGGSLLGCLPERFEAFHWHGDTFAMAPQARLLAASSACAHQAFQFDDHVLGMQFHLDYAQDSIAKMVDRCSDELTSGPFVQTDAGVLIDREKAESLKKYLYVLLDHCLARRFPSLLGE